MKLSDFDFDLPKDLIAQHPADKRDHSNLLYKNLDQNFQITKFYNLADHLREGDLLIFNNSKVINANITLLSDSKKINLNLNKPISSDKLVWMGFAKPAKKLSKGDVFSFGENQIIIEDKFDIGEIKLKFILPNISLYEFLEIYGKVPLPQYIKRNKESDSKLDAKRYQNIYSDPPGSVAAPTAGLHFTNEIFDKLKNNDKVSLISVSSNVKVIYSL
jgi:S-adenosylmethionine:tRNA ribosyltransferase-isomerase